MLLSDSTTLRLGGPAAAFVAATTDTQLLEALTAAERPILLLAGGSNLVVADEGFPGTVVQVATRGIERDGDALHVAAGEPWDALVAHTVGEGLAGIEALSGIPGSVGATPIQNVGAYGQEVSDTIMSVRAFDRTTAETVDLAPEDCGFTYRSSAFKRDPERYAVLRVSFALHASRSSRPIRYAELARALGVEVGETAPLLAVREAVLQLRRSKGMVLDANDPDTTSAGSFFTNPILDATAFAALRERAGENVPGFPEPDGRVKTSAAWLIDHAGFTKGYGNPAGIAISTKHVLALTNRGAGTTAELVALAQEIARGVEATFGVALHPEPVFVGHAWDPIAA
ncbi:UDP-N-acetylmuramate dehydrogenase [Baekduia sp.]|uniref:UDP-N-acetylmuramate dehydrogenase n=1 Tax=Baekduia sp. TaxID=2600305 RepID=UPI002DF78B82|nr:UDP-N-acetylmuramate dehydrogenase [Baekduia sp.]